MLQAVPLPIEDFPLDGPSSKELLKKISGSPLIKVKRNPIYPHGLCYWSVANHVKEHGGASVQGWQINWLPGFYIDATHHAIWQCPDGELIDLSMPSSDVAIKSGFTTFSKCASTNLNLEWPVLIENKHLVLHNAIEVKEALAKYRINNRTNVRFCDERRKNGWVWSVTRGWVDSGGRTPLMVTLNLELNKSYEELHIKRGELLEKFFSK